jgi:hypothetical protein
MHGHVGLEPPNKAFNSAPSKEHEQVFGSQPVLHGMAMNEKRGPCKHYIIGGGVPVNGVQYSPHPSTPARADPLTSADGADGTHSFAFWVIIRLGDKF